MAFTAPTYASSYSQSEQNANAVLVTAAINKLITAAQANQDAITALLNLRQVDNLFTTAANLSNSAAAARALLP